MLGCVRVTMVVNEGRETNLLRYWSAYTSRTLRCGCPLGRR